MTRFIEGSEWSPDDIKRPDIISRVADALRRVPLERLCSYTKALRDSGVLGDICKARLSFCSAFPVFDNLEYESFPQTLVQIEGTDHCGWG